MKIEVIILSVVASFFLMVYLVINKEDREG